MTVVSQSHEGLDSDSDESSFADGSKDEHKNGEDARPGVRKANEPPQYLPHSPSFGLNSATTPDPALQGGKSPL